MYKYRKMNRRNFLSVSSLGIVGLLLGCSPSDVSLISDDVVRHEFQKRQLAGLTACLINAHGIIWHSSYGQANIENRTPMGLDSILNIGSISKTITSTAIMQLWEQNRFRLDDNVSRFLPFELCNPFHPKEVITFRHLLTHSSSINDGPSYSMSYGCGDPTIPLGKWLKAYLTPDGCYFVKHENFNSWKPGEKFDYSNIGFGLLGYLVEIISGIPFNQYCHAMIFEPLDMKHSAWFLSECNGNRLAVPYARTSKRDIPHADLVENQGKYVAANNFAPYCFYGFPNYPDGLLRTSPGELSHFLIAIMNRGIYRGKRILKDETLQEILSGQTGAISLPDWMSYQGLAWNAGPLNSGQIVWGHSGSDPGISTRMHFNQESATGAIIFANSNADLWGLTNQLFDLARHI